MSLLFGSQKKLKKRVLIVIIMHTAAGVKANLMITGRDLIGWVGKEVDKVTWGM